MLVLSRAISARTSFICVRSVSASEVSTPSVNTSSPLTAMDAATMARSRRKGWLARLIGIFISVVPGDGSQVAEQARVVLSGRAERRAKRLDFDTQFLVEAALRGVALGSETAQ